MICKEVYKDKGKFSILGVSCNETELLSIVPEIKNACFDVDGQIQFQNYIDNLSDTGFNAPHQAYSVKSWQVGEGIAQVYLEKCCNVTFPWSSNRDLKNPASSLSGADLVGFHQEKFAFGEVKTSQEEATPPQVTSKADGLSKQLERLCLDVNLRWTLIQYLFHRCKDQSSYKKACEYYVQDNQDFNIFGILIRDTKPDIADWNYLNKHLNSHNTSRVSLTAIYLIITNGINALPNLVSGGKYDH
ncbi:MAG: hypothetical protein FE834_10395 [Gammaproteobacteria bacterium]|nr:hypothetical protein [Gammaproteobacteria bacterium]